MENLDQMRKGTTPLAILKLLIDAGEPMHGYQIARALERRSHGSFQFKEGLIYPRLHHMEREGLLRSAWEGEAGSRRRKVYRPTAEGTQRLADELQQWQTFVTSMDHLLGLPECGTLHSCTTECSGAYTCAAEGGSPWHGSSTR